MKVFVLTPNDRKDLFHLKIAVSDVEPDWMPETKEYAENIRRFAFTIDRAELEQLLRECLSSNGLGLSCEKHVSRP